MVATKYVISYNLQNKVTTAAMTDQEMEDPDSQLEVSKFFSKRFKKFHKTKTGTITCNSKISFTFYEMNLQSWLNILRHFDVRQNFRVTTSKTNCDYQ